MSCQRSWRDPTDDEKATVRRWFEEIQPCKRMRRGLLNIFKTGLSGKRFENFILLTGGGGNGKGLLLELFMYLLNKNGYAVMAHKDLLYASIKSGANPEARLLHKKRFMQFSEPNPHIPVRLDNINELTGNSSVTARTGHDFSKCGQNTELCATIVMDCNIPPRLVGHTGNSARRRWLVIPFPTTFTEDEELIDSDPIRYRPMDTRLKDEAIHEQYYCALFACLIEDDHTDNEVKVWEPGMSLKQCVPAEFEHNASEFLNESNILGRWIHETYEQVEETDSSGHVIHFEPIKELWKKYKDSESYDRLPRKQQDELTLKRFKSELLTVSTCKSLFREAKKVKLASTGNYNTQEGLVHVRVSDASAREQMEEELRRARTQTRKDEAQNEKRSRPVEFDADDTNDFVRRLKAKGSRALVGQSLEAARWLSCTTTTQPAMRGGSDRCGRSSRLVCRLLGCNCVCGVGSFRPHRLYCGVVLYSLHRPYVR